MSPPRRPRRAKGAKRSFTTKASAGFGWLGRMRTIVTAAANLPGNHNLVRAGHVGAAVPGTHKLVGAAHVGAAELPQGLGRGQRKCLAKHQHTHKNGNGRRRPSRTIG